MTQRKIQLEQLELTGSSLILPAGAMFPYGGLTAPANFLLCQGQSVLVATYPDLFAVLGYAFGGSGANFNVPNFQGRVAVGKNTSGAFATFAQQTGAETITLSASQVPNHTHTATGSTSTNGYHTHTVTGSVSMAGDHQHPGTWDSCDSGNGDKEIRNWNGSTKWYTGPAGAHTHTLSGASALGNGSHAHTVTVGVNPTTGGGGSHSNVQPSLVTQYIISTGV